MLKTIYSTENDVIDDVHTVSKHKISKLLYQRSVEKVRTSGRFLKSIWLARRKHTQHSEPVANLLALSRHVVIVLSCPRQVFKPEKVASLSQTPANLSETCPLARASGPASIMDFGLY